MDKVGSEYKSENLEQLSELGITIVNLPSYRPELKGCIEKFFDIIQNLFKPYLKGKGVVEPDFQERGAHDYRKNLTRPISLYGSAFPRRNGLCFVPIFLMPKNQSHAPSFLLFRKKARSAQLLTCKRVRDVSLSIH